MIQKTAPDKAAIKAAQKYDGSPHDLMTRQCEFSIKDCMGIYRLHRINEYGDCSLQIRRDKHHYETCATVTIPRKGELLISRRIDGITLQKRIKLSTIIILT